MKGIILAGGTDSCLFPLTKVTNEHLLPVYDKPIIYYPMQTLVNAGIENIMIILGWGHAGHFLELLDPVVEFREHLTYKISEEISGIARALGLAEDSSDGGSAAVILVDNIFQEIRSAFEDFTYGVRIFLREVTDANSFGAAEVSEDRILSIEEKPDIPKSDFAVTGLYIYDARVFKLIHYLNPSGRGKLEITVNNAYIQMGELSHSLLSGFWSDVGTFDSLIYAS